MTDVEIIRENIKDVLGVERHILQSLERQIGDSRVMSYRGAHDLLFKIQSVLNSHVTVLERHLSTTNGGYETKFKKTATNIMGTLAGLYSKMLNDEAVSRNLRDDYTSLNLAAISYGILHTTALALNDSVVAGMAYRHLAELTPLVVQLSDTVPIVVAEELLNNGKITDAGIAREALADLQRAWSHETVRVQ